MKQKEFTSSFVPPTPNEKKFEELILYIALKSEKDPNFGAVKLNKLLFFSDFLYFQQTGEAITGVAYQCLQEGPAPVRLLPVKEKLITEQSAIERSIDIGLSNPRKHIITMRKPDLSLFSGDEIAFVDQVIEELKGCSGNDLSKMTHHLPLWSLYEAYGQTGLPYSTILVSDRELTAAEKEYAESLSVSIA